ncbi:MAG TPA: hypothetical protein VI461_15300 [Chitinophagaceae bacterium]|nr:hypothetical protein [Chitinophagaceae bacterium]
MEEKSKKDNFLPAGEPGITENANQHFPEDSHAPKQVDSRESGVGSHKQPAVAETSADKQATENMEVHHKHHHDPPGHKEKAWKHYLFEFLMLFLAITAGFFIENQREHYVENKRAKDFAMLLIDDLYVDIAELNRASRVLSKIITASDSLAPLLNSPDIKNVPGGKLYYYEYWSGWRWRIISRDATLQQLKNSGSLRYMNSQLVRSILNYEESLKVIYLLQDKYEPEKIENWKLVQKVFDNDYFTELDRIKAARKDSSGRNFNVTDKEVMAFLSKNIVLNTYDKSTLFELKNWARNTSWSYTIQIGNLESAIQNARIAIDALKKEYHIE